MNFATMLNQQVTPLSERKPEEREVAPKFHTRFHKNDNRNRRNEAVRRYRAVMQGKGWMTTQQVTEAICAWNLSHGFNAINDAYSTLHKWSKENIVELKASDAKRGAKALFEWRWIG
jgi:hypothetical protein